MALELPIHIINKYLYNKAIAGTQEIHSVWNIKDFHNSLSNTMKPAGSRLYFDQAISGNHIDQMGPEIVKPSVRIIYDTVYPPIKGTMWALEKAQTVYYIYGSENTANNDDNVQFVKTYIYDTFKKFDESAQEVNNSLQASQNIRFKYIRADQESPDMDFLGDRATDDRYITSLILTYEYTKS